MSTSNDVWPATDNHPSPKPGSWTPGRIFLVIAGLLLFGPILFGAGLALLLLVGALLTG